MPPHRDAAQQAQNDAMLHHRAAAEAAILRTCVQKQRDRKISDSEKVSYSA